MLGFLKGKTKENVICSPCEGTVTPLTEVPDPTFSEKILGDGFAVIPSEGRFFAPADGEVTMVFDTLHAVTNCAGNGASAPCRTGDCYIKGRALPCACSSRRSGEAGRSLNGGRS